MNNKCRQILIAAILLIAPFVTYSQVRGYLGKKITMELNLNNSFARIASINKDYKKNTSSNFSPRQLNIYPELNLAYTVGKRTDIGVLVNRDVVDVRMGEVSFTFESSSNNTVNPNLEHINYSNNYDNTDYFDFTPNNPINKGISTTFQIYFRFYSKKYIAPVGFYHQIAFGYHRLKFDDRIIGNLKPVETYNSNNSNTTPIPLELKIQNFYIPKLSYFLGNKKVFKNGLYINSGINFNLPVSLKLRRLTNTYSSSSSSSNIVKSNSASYHYQYLRQLNDQFVRRQLLEFKIGIGIII